MKTFYLLDGHAQMFRAYFAPFRELSAPDGRNVKAVYVFTQLLLTLLGKRPEYVAVAFDVADETTFRKDEFEPYKAHREASPEDLHAQFDLVFDVLDAMGIAVLRKEGFEADDVIATVARHLPDDVELRIVSKDKDLHQILNDHVALYDPKDGALLRGPDLLASKGYTPEQAVEVQTLVGDPTDNVPGVQGIGVKTAAKLIAQYGTADAVLDAADQQTPKRREALLAARDLLPVTRRLVTLRRDVPIDVDLDAYATPIVDPDRMQPIFADLGFRSFQEVVRRLAPSGTPTGTATDDATSASEAVAAHTPEARPSGAPRRGRSDLADYGGGLFGEPSTQAASTGAETSPVGNGAGGAATGTGHRDTRRYVCVTDEATFEELRRAVEASPAIAIDTETTSLRARDALTIGVSLSTRAGEGWYLPLRADDATVLDPATTVPWLARLLADPAVLKVGQNLKYDLQTLRGAGIEVAGPLFDTMIAAALLRPERRGNGLDALALDLLGMELIPTEALIGKGKNQRSMTEVPLADLATYAAEDADATWRLYELLRDEVQAAPPALRALIEEVEFPLVRVLAEMEWRGVRVDLEVLSDIETRLAARVAELRTEIQSAAGRPFNPDSPSQLSDVLFDDLAMPVVKRTKTGRSTDASVLEELAATTDHPLPGLVLEYREASKLLGTYLAPLPGYVSPADGRLHASFHQVGAATGRLSSSDPNIQNIPVRTETGRLIRRAFVAGAEDRVLLTADYSQVELRMLAHLSGDRAMRSAFEAGLDVHAFVASQVYGIELDAVDADQRRVAKTVNFGIVYGQTAFGLAKTLRIPQGDAAAFIEAYKARYQGIDRFLATCIAQAEEHGFVETVMGRRRAVPEIRSRNRGLRNLGERLAINTVVQGSAADLIKLAMRNLEARLEGDDAVDAHMIIQVHDELVFDVLRAHADTAMAWVREEMTGAMTLDVPLAVDVAYGPNWAETKG